MQVVMDMWQFSFCLCHSIQYLKYLRKKSDWTHLICMLVSDFIAMISGDGSLFGQVCSPCPPLGQSFNSTALHGLR